MWRNRWFRVAVVSIVLAVITSAVTGYVIVSRMTNGVEDPVGQTQIPAVEEAAAPLQQSADTADWPSWRGPQGDLRSSVTGIRDDWSNGLKKLWQVGFLTQGRQSITYSAPVLQGNRLVVCGRDETRDLVFGLAPDTGALLWKGGYEARNKPNHGRGPRATPTIDGERVYTYGRGGDLACWQLTDGKMLWKRNLGEGPDWGHGSAPLVLDERVYVQGGAAGGRAVACDKDSGEVIWRTGDSKPAYAAPVPMVVGGETQILFFHAAGLSGHAADDGRELWTMPWTTPYDVNATTPVVRDNEVFITSGYGTGGALLEVAGDDYRVVWSNNALAAQHSDPVLIDGHLYGYTGDSNGRGSAFVCLEWATGNEKWRTNELGWGTVTWVDGRLLCQDRASNLYLVQAEPEGLTIQTTFQNAIPGIRQSALTVPVAANDKLYLRYRQLLVCYDLRKP